jgi:penicillin-binding protein 1C
VSRRRFVRVLAVLALGTAAAAGLSFYLPIPSGRLDPKPVLSFRIEDRHGLLLREVLSAEGGRCRWIGLVEASPVLLKTVLAAEDSRYLIHGGVNPYAVLRSFVLNLRRGRTVSGASTITQQVVRNIYRYRRSIVSKILEAWLAVRLEHTLSKEAILVQYLNRISYGNGAFGIEAAARLYFDKPAADLSPSEAAFLTAIPKAPSIRNPYRNPAAVIAGQRTVLARMADLGWLGRAELERALGEPVRFFSAAEKFRAPHFCDFVLARLPEETKRTTTALRTTLDLALQEKVEILVRSHLDGLEKRGLTNAAAIVLDNATGEILAMAGSRDFFDGSAAGQVNGVIALRQPGSALKPLTYALALERGLTAATILEDIPTQFASIDGSFAPDNYDRRFHGPIRLRSALASSYNVPAAAVLEALGPDLLYRKLQDLSFTSLKKPPDYYGVGLTLGNGEVTLLELARAYSSLARGGRYLPERFLLGAVDAEGRASEAPPPPRPRRVFSEEAAAVITDILADRDARVPTFGYLSALNLPFPAAAKTGTSKDYRDNWTLGYTPAVSVGVWAGNFYGSPMHNVSGMTGAGPLFRDILTLANGRSEEAFRVPPSLVRIGICPVSGERPSDRCPSSIEEIFVRGREPRGTCRLSHAVEAHPGPAPSSVPTVVPGAAPISFAVIFPRDGDVFKIDPVLRRDAQSVRFKAAVPPGWDVRIVEWWIDGRWAGRSGPPFSLTWNLSPGSYTIKARAVLESGERESPAVRITVIS